MLNMRDWDRVYSRFNKAGAEVGEANTLLASAGQETIPLNDLARFVNRQLGDLRRAAARAEQGEAINAIANEYAEAWYKELCGMLGVEAADV